MKIVDYIRNPHGRNAEAPVLRVHHQQLRRWTAESAYKSYCPVCLDGFLGMERKPPSLLLIREDFCYGCGQRVYYLDDQVNGEEFATPVAPERPEPHSP